MADSTVRELIENIEKQAAVLLLKTEELGGPFGIYDAPAEASATPSAPVIGQLARISDQLGLVTTRLHAIGMVLGTHENQAPTPSNMRLSALSRA